MSLATPVCCIKIIKIYFLAVDFPTLPVHAFPYRLDKYRPKKDPKFNDFSIEAHIYFDDAFEHVEGSRHLNEYAKNLVEVIKEVYGYVYMQSAINAFRSRIDFTILDYNLY